MVDSYYQHSLDEDSEELDSAIIWHNQLQSRMALYLSSQIKPQLQKMFAQTDAEKLIREKSNLELLKLYEQVFSVSTQILRHHRLLSEMHSSPCLLLTFYNNHAIDPRSREEAASIRHKICKQHA